MEPGTMKCEECGAPMTLFEANVIDKCDDEWPERASFGSHGTVVIKMVCSEALAADIIARPPSAPAR